MTAPAESPEPQPPAAPQASVFRHSGFRNYWVARLLVSFATQIISVAVGWQVYDLTRNPLDLGFVGLVQFLPSLLLVLVTGVVADRYSRRAITAICLGLEAIVCAGLIAFTVSA
ncbi:MAG TPA: MFS transporter, partial [Nordella sp.]|nr:MFS transporter [Nordella sp.]